jgi:hypothetical protein
MKTVLIAMMGVLLVAAAPPVKLAPADDKPTLVGAAARAKNGPDPMAKPPEDVGSAEDPAPGAAPLGAPPQVPANTQAPR